MSYDCFKWALKQPVKGVAKAVLLILAHHENKSGICWPSYETISSETGFDIRSCKRALKKLVEMNLIKIDKRYSDDGRQQSNHYIFRKLSTGEGDRVTPRGDRVTRGRVTESAKGGCQSVTHNIKSNSNIECDWFEKSENTKVQEMYRSNPTPLGDYLKAVLGPNLKPKP